MTNKRGRSSSEERPDSLGNGQKGVAPCFAGVASLVLSEGEQPKAEAEAEDCCGPLTRRLEKAAFPLFRCAPSGLEAQGYNEACDVTWSL